MKWQTRFAGTIGMVVALAAIAGADEWNDRTTLKFDAPMMIPRSNPAPGDVYIQAARYGSEPTRRADLQRGWHQADRHDERHSHEAHGADG